MMKIPYDQILEIRFMKNEIDKTHKTKLAKWFFEKGYYYNCRPIIRKLEASLDKPNFINPSEIISFANFVYETFVENGNISAIAKSNFGKGMYCEISFKNIGVVIKANEWSHLLSVTQHTKDKEIKKEYVALNTYIEVGKKVYEEMVNYIIRYLKGE